MTSTNKIVVENQKLGNPSTEWDINGMGDPTIQGFGHDISINVGEKIDFKIKTESIDYRIDIYRMGYYGGMGARKVDIVYPSVELPQTQPEGLRDPETKLYDCGNWAVSASWDCPADAVSGIYFARLVRQDPSPTSWRREVVKTPDTASPQVGAHAYGAAGHGKPANALKEPFASHIYFIVRDDTSHSDIIFQTADTTWQAYNRYGGHSTYAEMDEAYPRIHGKPNRAYKVSYNRPFETRHYRAVNKVFNGEYPFVRWLERNGYDVTYTTGVDSARRGELIQNHKLFLSVAHDEYWSAGQRKHVEDAREGGVNLAFFSGNEVFWKTRWEPSIDGTETDYRTMVTYKETQDNRRLDPEPGVWTGTWRDGRDFNPEGAQPENALTGTIFTVNAWRNDPLVVPYEYSHLRLWRNTKAADLKPGERAVLLKGLLGHEWDEDIDNGHRPPGLFRLSETTVDNVWYVQDEGGVFDSGTATHHLTMYRHESGALVFGAGTVQWSWGLDSHHDTDTGVPPEKANPSSTRVGTDPNGPDMVVQQATVNLFADMGIQPARLQDDLVPAEASTDTKPPTSRVTHPADGSLLSLNPIQIKGTAKDFGGGAVAGVEVSVNGGERWHPAVGREDWHFDWHPAEEGNYTICCRAVDDSGNLEQALSKVTITISVK
ncbi:MAG: N,N-dimethylformamidase beta subunit family domain-containing protein [Chloroflexota bacterium]